jgi:broad specificity phosphatase PhoE
LNETGSNQATAFYEAYKHIVFDTVYTSALRRTTESVQKFIDIGIPHVPLAGLNEISWGEKEGHTITPAEDEYYHYVLNQWQRGHTDLRIEGGESPEEVVKRLKPATDFILSKTDEKTILVCMHGRAIRILLCYLLHYPLKSMDMFEHKNLGLYLLNHTSSMFSIERYNDVTHLRSFS